MRTNDQEPSKAPGSSVGIWKVMPSLGEVGQSAQHLEGNQEVLFRWGMGVVVECIRNSASNEEVLELVHVSKKEKLNQHCRSGNKRIEDRHLGK